MAKKIPLTKGRFALVDDDDFAWLARMKWCVSGGLYGARQRGPTLVLMHRLILGEPAGHVDHINGDGFDNRRENLRLASPLQNQWNRRSSRGSTSRFKGVYFDVKYNNWKACISLRERRPDGRQGKTLHLGTYLTEEEAARAYDRHARQVHGQFARLNFPEDGEQTALWV
jgi:hypothetical protein